MSHERPICRNRFSTFSSQPHCLLILQCRSDRAVLRSRVVVSSAYVKQVRESSVRKGMTLTAEFTINYLVTEEGRVDLRTNRSITHDNCSERRKSGRGLACDLCFADWLLFLELACCSGFELIAQCIGEDKALLDRCLLKHRYKRHGVNLTCDTDILFVAKIG